MDKYQKRGDLADDRLAAESTTSTHSEMKPDEPETWQHYTQDLRRKLLLERIREATAARDGRKLAECLKEIEVFPELNEYKDVIKGKRVLHIVQNQDNLKEAMAEGKIPNIKKAIKDIEQDDRLKGPLQQDVITARSQIDKLRRGRHPNDAVLAMNKKTMTEMRRYTNPPWMIKRVMQAVFLLLGEPEDLTDDWGYCLMLLNPYGKDGMYKKIMEMEINYGKMEPAICIAAKDILINDNEEDNKRRDAIAKTKKEWDKLLINLPNIKAVSSAGATFYVWAMGIIEKYEQEYEHDVLAATRTEQRILFKKGLYFGNYQPQAPRNRRNHRMPNPKRGSGFLIRTDPKGDDANDEY